MACGIRGRKISTTLAIVCVLMIVMPEATNARPSGQIVRRQKRVSDQRLAELETLLALKGHLVTVPIAFGKVDPALVGRRRRSSPDEDTLNTIKRNIELGLGVPDTDSQEGSELLYLVMKELSKRREEDDDAEYAMM